VRGARGGRSGAQIRAVLSVLAVASQDPSGAIATARTRCLWPVRVARGVPSAAQIRAVLSPLAVASQDPSGAIATAVTESPWPVRVFISRSDSSGSPLPGLPVDMRSADPLALLRASQKIGAAIAHTATTPARPPSAARGRPVKTRHRPDRTHRAKSPG